VVHIYIGGDRSAVSDYRPISLNFEISKQSEHVIAGYLRKVCDKNYWLCEGHHGFKEGYSCDCQVNTVRQDMAGSLDEVIFIYAIIIDFSKAFVLVPHDRLFTKLVASGVDSKVVVWVREFLVGRTERVRVGGQQSKEVKVNSSVPQGNVLCTLLFIVYLSDIWKNIDSSNRPFADYCTIYGKITNKNKIENFRKDLDTLGECAVENGMKINPGKIRQ